MLRTPRARLVTALRSAIKGSEFVLLPDAGHFPFVEHPEAVMTIVRGFVEQHPL